MEQVLISNLIDIFAVSMLLTSLLAMTSTRMRPLIRLFVIQAIFLTAFEITVAYSQNDPKIYVMAALTILIKVIIIPKLLIYIIDRINVRDDVSLKIGIPGSLLLSAALILLSYYISEPLVSILDTAERNSLVLSFSMILIGLLMMSTRHKAISEVIGLLMAENGLFMGAIALSNGMPFIVEVGAFIDVLMAVIIIGVFAFRVNKTFDKLEPTPIGGLEKE
ncbi:MAG TPA: hydrogenase [Candidatus Methanomethylophilaceae archaeon]|nr:hydrogenase [Candidatus Methanomethylophilaceae archaeon]